MAKKTTGTTSGSAGGAPGAVGKGKAKAPDEFLVLDIGGSSAVGSKATILHVTGSLGKAREYVGAMSGASPSRIAIVERKQVLTRQPQIAVIETVETILTQQPSGTKGQVKGVEL